MSDHAAKIRRFPSEWMDEEGVWWVGRADFDALAAWCDALENALREYAGHQSWRCEYRSRYGACQCELDETLEKLGLPPVPVDDPEVRRVVGERQET